MKNLILCLMIFTCLFACGQKTKSSKKENHKIHKDQPSKNLDGLQTAYFASGCFWCVEAIFESVKGVEEVLSGYSGGKEKNPTYEYVSSGVSRHAESVKVYYDSTIISYKDLLIVFFGSHDPTTLNRQGPDKGQQYRSIVFYQNENEKKLALTYIDKLLKDQVFPKITTEVIRYQIFWEAEAYHQNYERNHPDDSYVKNVSVPRINEFKRKYPQYLK